MEDINNEIKTLEKEISNKKQEITNIERKIKDLRSKLESPDIEGKCIKIHKGIQTTYIKVKKVDNTDTLGIIAQGVIVDVLLQLIEISYSVTNRGFYTLPIKSSIDFEIISDDEFNKILEEAIKSFK